MSDLSWSNAANVSKTNMIIVFKFTCRQVIVLPEYTRLDVLLLHPDEPQWVKTDPPEIEIKSSYKTRGR